MLEDFFDYGRPRVVFDTLSCSPNWFQYFINEFWWLVLCGISAWLYVFAEFDYHEYFGYAVFILVMYLAYKIMYIARTEYIVTSEQLILLSGVFSHSTDYVELYRIVDYQQHQSAIQQLVGLKTVTIFSGDRNNPKVNLIGIKAKEDIVSTIRIRVEYNKRLKGVYELTNRP